MTEHEKNCVLRAAEKKVNEIHAAIVEKDDDMLNALVTSSLAAESWHELVKHTCEHPEYGSLEFLINKFNNKFDSDGFCDVDMLVQFIRENKDNKEVFHLLQLYSGYDIWFFFTACTELQDDVSECKAIAKKITFNTSTEKWEANW